MNETPYKYSHKNDHSDLYYIKINNYSMFCYRCQSGVQNKIRKYMNYLQYKLPEYKLQLIDMTPAKYTITNLYNKEDIDY